MQRQMGNPGPGRLEGGRHAVYLIIAGTATGRTATGAGTATSYRIRQSGTVAGKGAEPG